jgi:hypothetical protein
MFELSADAIAQWKIVFDLIYRIRVARCVQRCNGVVHTSKSLVVLAVRLLCKRTIEERVMKELLLLDYSKEVRNTTQLCR